jgi:hypothetical protein
MKLIKFYLSRGVGKNRFSEMTRVIFRNMIFWLNIIVYRKLEDVYGC